MLARKWWKEAVVYQIYTKSFYDTNGDGIGDLPGIIKKLDYLKGLGVDVIWLCPVYDSPNADNGYDIADYYSIDKQYGGMEAWDELLREMHKRDMKLIMDLVINHTSSKHNWFKQSRSSKENPYRDYYIWRDGKDGKEPNNWASYFTPSAWELDPQTNQYYLHLFASEQPDLNWKNPKVKDEIFSMIKWWMDKGIDGFRMDVINHLCKKDGFLDSDKASEFGSNYVFDADMFTNQAGVHEILREMNENILCYYDILTVGETPNVTPESGLLYVEEDRKELDMIFSFELMLLGCGKNGKWDVLDWKLSDFKRIIRKWQTQLDGKGWNSIYLNNHDQPRMVSRFGNDSKFREVSAKALATLNFTLQGTPYIYQGEEIGMTNVPFESMDDYNDLDTHNAYSQMKASGSLSEEEIMDRIRQKSRDNARTPMQWDTSDHAGFSEGTPWLKVNPNYKDINVVESTENKGSVLHYYRQLIQVRKSNATLVYGHYQEFYEEDEEIYCYKRYDEDNSFFVIINFTDKEVSCHLPCEVNLSGAMLEISNYDNTDISESHLLLQPYEARVYKLI
ncbi:alpha-glucosidase [Oscillospiraceae bacterium PP1C4]